MSGHWPTLDPEALAALRGLVQAMYARGGQPVPLSELAAQSLERLGVGVMIDFEASYQLGEPVVVLRLGRPPGPDALVTLSQRERDVAGLVTSGLSNKQIARRLSVTLATVKYLVHRILDKAALPNRAAIAATWCRRKVFAG